MVDAPPRGPVRKLVRGLNASVCGNAQAFGFSITVTVTFGVVDAAQPHPSRLDLLGFAMTAVAAFSLLNVIVALRLRNRPDTPPPTRAMLIGTATDFLAVAAAVGAAIGVTAALTGWAAWLLAPFLAGLLYVLVQAVELTVGQETED